MKNNDREILEKVINRETTLEWDDRFYAKSFQAMPYFRDKSIILQMNGWCIELHDDGTWEWEDTTGG